jgi:SagB-type dehydrogenase family enzyme
MRYVLAQQVFFRPEPEGWYLDGPFLKRTFVASSAILRLLMLFRTPQELELLCKGRSAEESAVIQRFARLAESAGVLIPANDLPNRRQDEFDTQKWDFHDLLFHTSSREGTNRGAIGATYRFGDEVCPEPAIARGVSSRLSVSLQIPQLLPDHSIVDVLSNRRTRYECGPMPLEVLSAFLFHTCRVTQTLKNGTDTLVTKLYPSGGSRHPLEVYALAFRCPGLGPGLYHYESNDHRLSLVQSWNTELEAFLIDAVQATGCLKEYPSVLFLISARFARTAFKYEGIAYRLILIELGALFQTMYLVASWMNLAPCALGSGNSRRFSDVIGVNAGSETTVGEFMLSARDGHTA